MAQDIDALLSKYGATPQAPKPAASTDIDALLSKYGAAPEPIVKEEPSMMSMKGLLKGAVRSLPTAGALAGGAIGTVGGPIGSVAGAGLGGVAGKSLQNILAPYLDEDTAPKTSKEALLGPVKEGVEQAAGQAGGGIVAKGLSQLPKAATYLASQATNIPTQSIKTYAKFNKEVRGLLTQYGDDLASASDDVKQSIQDAVKSTRQSLGQTVGKTLEKSTKTTSIDPVIGVLESKISKLSEAEKIASKDSVQEIKGLITNLKKIRSASGEVGQIDAASLNTVKEYLQDAAKPVYGPTGFFPKSDVVAQTARSAAAEARGILNKLEPSVAAANNQLSKLHGLEDIVNKNMITVGKSDAALLSAGRGVNLQAQKQLTDLGKITGQDLLGKAQQLSAARDLGQAQLLPGDTTGKSATRLGAGAGLGFLAGGAPGALVGGALTSPAALKLAIDAGQIPAEIIKRLGGVEAARTLVSTPQGAAILGQMIKAAILDGDK